jgi:hypothetical protein
VDVSDLNELGCMARAKLSETEYAGIQQQTCSGHLDLSAHVGLPARLSVKTVWIDEQGEQIYSIGLYFENVSKAQAQSIRSFVNNYWPDQTSEPS